MRILITGASSGIGCYLAERFVKSGHEVWGVARSEFPAMDSLSGAAVRSADFCYSRCDVSDWASVKDLRVEIGMKWSSLDVLICCGGVQAPIGPSMQVDPAQWSANISTNLNGVFFAVRAFFDLLMTGRTSGHAKVLCFSGGGASSPRPNFMAYACAKAAVVRLAENLSVEWKGLPVDINAVAPGAIPTGMTREVLALGAGQTGAKEFAGAEKLVQAGGAPMERAGDLVEYLISSASDGISGRLLSAPWDPWASLHVHSAELDGSDIYTLRRITPEERQKKW